LRKAMVGETINHGGVL